MDNNETITPESLTRFKTYASVTLGFVVAIAGVAFAPFMILSLFFFTHASLMVATRHNAFLQKLLFGPLKLATAGFMILAGIPTDNTVFAIFWIGISFLLVVSGVKNLYTIMRSAAPVSQTVSVRSARQQEKAIREEERLLADLGSLLGDD